MGCHLWGRTESDTTEVTWQRQQLKRAILFLASLLTVSLNLIPAISSLPTISIPQKMPHAKTLTLLRKFHSKLKEEREIFSFT